MRAHPGREDGFRPPGAAHRTHLLLGDHLSGGRASKSRGPPAVCPCRPGPLSRRGVPVSRPQHRRPVCRGGQRAALDPVRATPLAHPGDLLH